MFCDAIESTRLPLESAGRRLTGGRYRVAAGMVAQHELVKLTSMPSARSESFLDSN